MDYLNRIDARLMGLELTNGAHADRLPVVKAIYDQLFPQYAATPFLWKALQDLALAPADADPNFIHHLWLLYFDGQPVGMTHFSYCVSRQVGLGIYIAVLPQYRKQMVGSYARLSEASIAATHLALAEDVRRLGHAPLSGFFAEVDLQKLTRQYEKYGFLLLPVAYEEPRLPEGLESYPGPQVYQFHPLHLGFFPSSACAERPTVDVLRRAVQAFLVDFYGLPEDHPKVQQSLQSLTSLEE